MANIIKKIKTTSGDLQIEPIQASETQIGGVKVDGTSITINDEGIIGLDKFLPDGTTITVGTDKQYTTIGDALDYLSDKWSNGAITIQVDSGTYNITERLVLGNPNIEYKLIGDSTTKPVVVMPFDNIGLHSNTGGIIAVENNTKVTIENFKFTTDLTSKPSDNNRYGIFITNSFFTILNNVELANISRGIVVFNQSSVELRNYMTFTNCIEGIRTTVGKTVSCTNTAEYNRTNFIANNVTTLLTVACGGTIVLWDNPKTLTSVTNVTSQSIGTLTIQGAILGGFAAS